MVFRHLAAEIIKGFHFFRGLINGGIPIEGIGGAGARHCAVLHDGRQHPLDAAAPLFFGHPDIHFEPAAARHGIGHCAPLDDAHVHRSALFQVGQGLDR